MQNESEESSDKPEEKRYRGLCFTWTEENGIVITGSDLIDDQSYPEVPCLRPGYQREKI